MTFSDADRAALAALLAKLIEPAEEPVETVTDWAQVEEDRRVAEHAHEIEVIEATAAADVAVIEALADATPPPPTPVVVIDAGADIDAAELSAADLDTDTVLPDLPTPPALLDAFDSATDILAPTPVVEVDTLDVLPDVVPDDTHWFRRRR